MATSLYVPGPSPVAISASGGTPQFLGYTVDGVTLREEQYDVPVLTDYGGPRMPADIMLAGKVVTATCRLIDYDPLVISQIFARFSSGVAGQIQPNEIGTLINAEAQFLTFMVKAHRQSLVPRYANFLAGFRMPTCFVRALVEFSFSNAPQIVPISVFAFPAINKVTLAGSIWDTNLASFPTPT